MPYAGLSYRCVGSNVPICFALSAKPSMPSRFDWKGRDVTTDASLEYTYCVRCMVVRELRDYKFVVSKECAGSVFGGPMVEGDYLLIGTHIFRCFLPNGNEPAPSPNCAVFGVLFPSGPPPRYRWSRALQAVEHTLILPMAKGTSFFLLPLTLC